MQRTLSAFGALILSANIAFAQCECATDPFVDYKLLEERELDETPWRVKQVYLAPLDGAEVCVVELEMIQHYEPILYEPVTELIEDEFEVYFGNHWLGSFTFETLMEKSHCLTLSERG